MGDVFRDPFEQQIELTEEQQACVNYTGERTLMVKGYAGSGKSIVLMAAAKKYQEAYQNADRPKVAIFTYQNTLVSTIKETLSINGEEPHAVFVSTSSSFLHELYQALVTMEIAPKVNFFKTNEKREAIVTEILREHQEQYGKHRFQRIGPDFWLGEFDWMKDILPPLIFL